MAEVHHLVLSAGGQNAFVIYGACRESARLGAWSPENVESVHGSSAGAVVGAMLAMGYDWNWLDDYLLRRPWDTVLAADERMLDAYTSGGVYGTEVMEGILGPLLEAKHMSVDVSLREFKEETGVSVHTVATDLNRFSLTKVVLGPDTFPECPLVTAVAASAAYPFLCRPVHYEGMSLVDGGVMSMYPMSECLGNGWDPASVLGVRLSWPMQAVPLAPSASMLDVAAALFRCTWRTVCSDDHKRRVPEGVVEVVSEANNMTYDSLRAAVTSQAEREKLIERGVAAARECIIQSPAALVPPKETSAGTGSETERRASRRSPPPCHHSPV